MPAPVLPAVATDDALPAPNSARVPVDLLLVGGVFDEQGGRASGYFRKLAEALIEALRPASCQILNGGQYSTLATEMAQIDKVTHVFWFADIPNSLPKLLPQLKQLHPNLILIQSKNNQRGAYTREQLVERMTASHSHFLLEFTTGNNGQLLATLLAYNGSAVIENCPDIDEVAEAFYQVFTFFDSGPLAPKRICLVGKTGPVSEALQAKLGGRLDVSLTVLSGQESIADPDFGNNASVLSADLIVLCVQDFASPQLMQKMPATCRVLDISPAFRTNVDWVYGLPEMPGQTDQIRGAQLVANPGCFATAAILMLGPLEEAGWLEDLPAIYLDATGGYSTGGAALESKHAEGTLPADAVYSLQKEHRHIEEIVHHSKILCPLWFTPKIGNFPRGIRAQIPLMGISPVAVLETLDEAYSDTEVEVSVGNPTKLSAEYWVGNKGACLHVIEQPGGCLLICTLDNLGKGAVDSAMTNIELMLGLMKG